MLNDDDPVKSNRVMQAMLQIAKIDFAGAQYNNNDRASFLSVRDRKKEVATMRTMTPGTMVPRHQMSTDMKTLLGKKHRLMTNHNVHVITHHGKIMVGRKGRNV